MFVWISNGKEMQLSEMTTEHLINALIYTYRIKKLFDYNCLKILEEIQNREKELYYSQSISCPWCDGIMNPKKFEGDKENWEWPTYRFVCGCCNSTSGLIQPPKISNARSFITFDDSI